jgi:hypothetical protein
VKLALDHGDHVDRVRLYLGTVATNRPIVHPQVMYEHGEPWWNDSDRGKLLIQPFELSDNHTNSHLVAKQEELAKETNLALQNIVVHT